MMDDEKPLESEWLIDKFGAKDAFYDQKVGMLIAYGAKFITGDDGEILAADSDDDEA